jgi:uncharacterized lipoprotein YmbA
MKIFFFGFKMAAVLILWLALAGCMLQRSAPNNFYMLTPLAPSAVKPPADAGIIVIAIQEVQIPGYLDRPQIVTRLNDTEYKLAEFNRWTEGLGDTLTRVIAENLSRQLSSGSVQVFPAASSIPFDYRIEVEVIRLDGQLGHQATLIARWSILGHEEDDLIRLQRSEYQETVEDNTYKGLVLAQSRAVEKLSRDIADAIKKTLANRGKK